MRPKLSKEKKRSELIGVKVKPRITKQLEYLSGAEGIQTPTYINMLIEQHIEQVTKDKNINWQKELEESQEI